MTKRVKDFFYRQVYHVRKGGLRILLSKFFAIPLIALAIPAIFLVRIMRPLLLIRFGGLISARYAHFAVPAEIYLCSRDMGVDDKKAFDIFYCMGPISNRQLKKMLGRVMRIWQIACWCDKVNQFIPGGEKHIIPMSYYRDPHGLLMRTSPHLYFTKEEEKRGQRELAKMSIPQGAPFVCFHARTPDYLNTVYPDYDWTYHNYRDTDINNYIPAVMELVRRGYYAVRMGAVVKEKLKIKNPRIIDYAANYRTDFLDVYLGAKCSFFIGDTAGIYAVSAVFRRPVIFVNHIPLNDIHGWGKDYLSIPKKLWLQGERRFLTFREMLDFDMNFFAKMGHQRLGIEPVENTPEEITALVVEMDERLKGTWRINEEDERLQRRFWTLFKPSELNKVFISRIGAEFLRQNARLLEQETGDGRWEKKITSLK